MYSSIFADEEVLSPDYIPAVLIHRERQMRQLHYSLRPATRGQKPIDCFVLGPPSTGKTTAVKLVFRQLQDFDNIVTCYVNCQIVKKTQQILSIVYESLHGRRPPTHGVPFDRLFDRIFQKLLDEEKVLIVALDDINFVVSDKTLNEMLYTFLRCHEMVDGIRIGIIAIATDLKLKARLDPRLLYVQSEDIMFPPYDFDEIRDILNERIKWAFRCKFTDEALNRIYELTYENKDLRYGLKLLRLSGIIAEEKSKNRVELEDVIEAVEEAEIVMIEKLLGALNTRERLLIKVLYEMGGEADSTDLYLKLSEKIDLGDTLFKNIVRRLEHVRMIDTYYTRKGKGRGRIILLRHKDWISKWLHWI